MKNINLYLSLSLSFVALVIGLAFGYFLSPSYQQTMYVRDSMGLGNVDRFIDLRYINQMAAHHRGAILLADQISDQTRREEVKKLAKEIQESEPKLIAELYAWKREWFNDSRIIKDPVVPRLGAYDEKIDLRFLNSLIAHHVEGINMAKEIKLKSSRKEVIDNAYAVENFLTNSLVTLNTWREQWYGIK